MSKLDDIFARLHREGRTALMPFITGGFPTLEDTEAVLPALADAGASVIEVGIPFSDPIADGPVIAASMHEALIAGITPERVFDVVKRVAPRIDAGLIAMLSCSIVLRSDATRFFDDVAEAGFDGVILPDLDLVDAPRLRALALERDLGFTLLVSPTTPSDRFRAIAEMCSGFVYLLARVGITGERSDAPDVDQRVAQLRAVTDLPIAVGFGISRPEHVRAVTATADAAIVGSALVRRMADADDPVQAAANFVRELAGALAVAESS